MTKQFLILKKIISGGQTGADKAGLIVGKDLGYETGGFAPKGWRIQNFDGSDGSDPSLADYGLIQHPSREYPPRTKKNVEISDGTVWVGYAESPGGKLTIGTCKKLGKPCIINPSANELRQWLIDNKVEVLNVAGNRLSEFNPSIEGETWELLTAALLPF